MYLISDVGIDPIVFLTFVGFTGYTLKDFYVNLSITTLDLTRYNHLQDIIVYDYTFTHRILTFL